MFLELFPRTQHCLGSGDPETNQTAGNSHSSRGNQSNNQHNMVNTIGYVQDSKVAQKRALNTLGRAREQPKDVEFRRAIRAFQNKELQ